jgi:hypothetical protein
MDAYRIAMKHGLAIARTSHDQDSLNENKHMLKFLENYIDDAEVIQYLDSSNAIKSFSVAYVRDGDIGERVAAMCNYTANLANGANAVSISTDDSPIMIVWVHRVVNSRKDFIEYVFELYKAGSLPKLEEVAGDRL